MPGAFHPAYDPVAGSTALSALVAAAPLVVLGILLALARVTPWKAAAAGALTAFALAVVVWRMPLALAVSAATHGMAYGLWPISWIVLNAVFFYNLTVASGDFDVIRRSLARLTADRRVQCLLVAFCFGALIEGIAGFGAPVAISASMLAGLGFAPVTAAVLALVANTAPVAFGSIGVPVVTLAGTTGLPELELSTWVGRLCAPISLFIPAYLILVMGGFKGLKGVLPAAIVCGVCFASVQFLISNYIGPQLVDIIAAITAIIGLVVLLKVWHPTDSFVLEGEHQATIAPKSYGFGRTLLAWSPYLFLVVFVLIWGYPVTKTMLETTNVVFDWPGLHNQVVRVAPIVAAPSPYAARFTFNWLAAAGSACALATVAAALVMRLSIGAYFVILGKVLKQLSFSLATIAMVLGLAYVMNYSGATVTLGEAFAKTGVVFPYFSAMLGWLGVFLTGSDTSANALFGNLQVVTAKSLGLNPAMMAASNSAGGVMGKMISLTSLAVAVAATGMERSEEGKLFRFTVKHSVLLASALGILATIYAYLG
jgi:L-lactate transport